MPRCEGIITDERNPNVGGQCSRRAVSGATKCAVHGGLDELDDHVPMRWGVKCSATNNRGNPCGNWAVRGATVCKNHGGMTPAVQKKAKERLIAMVDPALAQLIRIIEKSGTTDADRIRAIQLVLDRTGYHAKSEITAEIKPWMEMVGDAGGTAQILRDLPEDIVDAEVIDDDDHSGDPLALPEVQEAMRRQPDSIEQVKFSEPEGATVVPINSRRTPPSHLR